MKPDVSERLRTETRGLHTAAERSAFMQALLGGKLDRPAYCALLRSLHTVYAALEPALLRHADDPLIVSVFQPALRRLPSLEQDLLTLDGPGWPDGFEPAPAALDYASRIRALEENAPGLLLAHAYVRYLGDLSGGQTLRRIVAGSAGIGDAVAVSFYDFGDAAQVRALTRAFRHGLSTLRPSAAVGDALVAEATLGFGLHLRLFEELAERHGLTQGTPCVDRIG